MGLDIYLRQYKNFDDTKRREAEYEERTNPLWEQVYGVKNDDNDGYEALKKKLGETEMDKLYDKYKELCKPIADELHLDKWGSDEDGSTDIAETSKKHPKHDLFKIGYLRSSYNESGMEHVVGEATGKDLHYIFQPPEDEYEFQPDWEACLKRAKQARKAFDKYLEEVGPYRVTEAHWNEFMGHPNEWPIKNKKDAMELFKKELAKYRTNVKEQGKDAMSAYSNKEGEFYFDAPLQVVSLITGVQKRFFVEECLPCTYIVYKSEGEEGLDFYLEALDIVIETIEYAIASPDRDNLYLAWSS